MDSSRALLYIYIQLLLFNRIGMTHDGEGGNKCVNEAKRGSIMAPLVMANLHNYFWSPCSKEEMNTIVRSVELLRLVIKSTAVMVNFLNLFSSSL